MHYLDHIILGVSDLAVGLEQFENLTGVRPARGGEHPELGTHNALVSLGERSYLEILAPRPDAEPVDWLQRLAGLTEITPVMWVVGTDDISHTVDLLAREDVLIADPTAGSRATAEGSVLRWELARPKDPALAESLFFVNWDSASIHPSRTSPGGCTLDSFEIADPNPKRLRTILDTLGLNISLYKGESQVIEVALRCPNGRVRLTSAA